jgi:hypothetical protein
MTTLKMNQSVRASLVTMGALAALVGLTSCLGTNNEDDSDNGFSYSSEGEVVAHAAPQGTTPGLMVVDVREYTCWGDTVDVLPNPEETIERDSSRYVISGGTLYLWAQHDCWASTYSGTSSSIFGTWTSNSFNETKLPAAYRSDACLEEYEICEQEGDCADAYPEDGSYENLNLVTTINPTQVRSSLSGQLCMARNYARNIMGDTFASGLDSVSMGCGFAQIRNKAQNTTATISSKSENQLFSVKFQYDTTTCTLTTAFGSVTPNSQCSDFAVSADLSEFYSCIFTSGFFEGIGFTEDEGVSLGKQSTERAQTALEVLTGRSRLAR